LVVDGLNLFGRGQIKLVHARQYDRLFGL
jgi:hypothetical protein